MAVTIRSVIASDIEAIIDLQWELNLFEDAVSHDRVTDRESSRLCVEDNLANTARDGGATLVAEADGVIVGYLSLVFKAGEPFVHPTKRSHGYVQDIVVKAAQRGGGIAQLLLAEAERISREAGLSGLSLGMLVGNDTAERAYLRFGFQPHSVEMLKRF
ncbi:MAG: GNAT family N-acetyltransferase [Beijerinckiaceae bacterium]